MTSTTATKNGSNGRANSIHMMTENNGLDLNPDQEEPESLPLRVFLSLYFDTKVKLDVQNLLEKCMQSVFTLKKLPFSRKY